MVMPTGGGRRAAPLLLLIVTLPLGLAGCATYNGAGLDRHIVGQQPRLALKDLDAQAGSSRSNVLYWLNKAMLHRMAGELKEANQAFESAKALIGEREVFSITEQLGSVTVNDATRSYIGEGFERVLLYTYAALNYLEDGQTDPARVEALQLDVELRRQAETAGKNVSVEIGFARLVTGLVYEQLGEWSDAMIAYRKAFEAFQSAKATPPSVLGPALVRLADRLGLDDERDRYAASFATRDVQSVTQQGELGELVVTVHAGLAPVKREQSVNVYSSDLQRMLRIATPYYQVRSNAVAAVRVLVDDKTYGADQVADIDALAQKTLEAQMPAITARALARAVVKYRAAKEADKHDSALGLLVNIAGVLSESADTRTWSTLPQRVYLARIALPPGTHTARLELLGAAGNVLAAREFAALELKAGGRQYRSLHWVGSESLMRSRAP